MSVCQRDAPPASASGRDRQIAGTRHGFSLSDFAYLLDKRSKIIIKWITRGTVTRGTTQRQKHSVLVREARRRRAVVERSATHRRARPSVLVHVERPRALFHGPSPSAGTFSHTHSHWLPPQPDRRGPEPRPGALERVRPRALFHGPLTQRGHAPRTPTGTAAPTAEHDGARSSACPCTLAPARSLTRYRTLLHTHSHWLPHRRQTVHSSACVPARSFTRYRFPRARPRTPTATGAPTAGHDGAQRPASRRASRLAPSPRMKFAWTMTRWRELWRTWW